MNKAAHILPDSLSDSDLLEGWIRDRQTSSLTTLIQRYSVLVLSTCRRRCRCDADAEDAYQTTFLYLARNAAKIRRPECLPGWLQRVAQRSAVATLKNQRQEPEAVAQDPAQPEDPLDRLTQRHEAIVLDEELSALPERYRSALVMHIMENKSVAQLADQFDTTTGTIRGRLQRGKSMLARRLRKRGVVPVMAFAAASAWMVSAKTASASAAAISADLGSGPLPDPPVDTSLLESLLSNGSKTMTSIYTLTSLVGGVAVALLISLPSPADQALEKNGKNVVQRTLDRPAEDAVLAQFGAPGGNPNAEQKPGLGGGGFGGGNIAPAANNAAPGKMVMVSKTAVPKPTSETSKRAHEELDKKFTVSFQGPLNQLTEGIESLNVPIVLDARGLTFAKVAEDTILNIKSADLPLRTILMQALRPLGLKATIADEGIVITSDPTELVHQGIGVSRWVNIDQAFAEEAEKQLAEQVQINLRKTSLSTFVEWLAEEYDTPIKIDEIALEDIGLTADVEISVRSRKSSMGSILKGALRPLDLVLHLENESLVITTIDESEQRLLTRIYWLEGTGFAGQDMDSIINAIQTSIDPDTWEALGGPSTIAPLNTVRPAIMVSSSYRSHTQLSAVFRALREAYSGPEPVLENQMVPASTMGPQGGMMGGPGGAGFSGPIF